ncbi:unnamed protein product [Chrysodeixis includens]|uniref:Uncharacterized protein n=1 Tax=Chrysodeixis includens TaxID=689277 RepID=A0A9P0FSU0_CHRIL|nr:unnamed protein product [Chrysodeixis includens]
MEFLEDIFDYFRMNSKCFVYIIKSFMIMPLICFIQTSFLFTLMYFILWKCRDPKLNQSTKTKQKTEHIYLPNPPNPFLPAHNFQNYSRAFSFHTRFINIASLEDHTHNDTKTSSVLMV